MTPFKLFRLQQVSNLKSTQLKIIFFNMISQVFVCIYYSIIFIDLITPKVLMIDESMNEYFINFFEF
jgi:hypothetical protein